MNFNETCVYGVLASPTKVWKGTNPYSFALTVPLLLPCFLVALPFAVLIDGYFALNHAFDSSLQG